VRGGTNEGKPRKPGASGPSSRSRTIPRCPHGRTPGGFRRPKQALAGSSLTSEGPQDGLQLQEVLPLDNSWSVEPCVDEVEAVLPRTGHAPDNEGPSGRPGATRGESGQVGAQELPLRPSSQHSSQQWGLRFRPRDDRFWQPISYASPPVHGCRKTGCHRWGGLEPPTSRF